MNLSERSGRNDLLSNHWLFLGGGAAMAIAGWVMTFRLRAAMDIFFLDETGYLIRGLNMFPKIPKLWGPVYCFWYKILSFFESVPVDLFYLNFGLISVLLAVVMYMFLLRFRVAWPVALWLSFMVLITPYNLPTFPKVSHFAAIFGMSGLMLAYYIKHDQNRYILVALLFLVMSFIRPEFYLAFLACSLGIAAGWATRRLRFEWTSYLLAGLVVIVLLHIGLGMPLGVELRGYKRSFIAFGEHFSWNYSKWYDLEGYLWLTWEAVTRSEFGDSTNFGSALKSNPGMMFKHIFYNLGIYIDELCRTLTSGILPLKNQPSIVRYIAPIFMAALLLVPSIRRDYRKRLLHHRALLVFLILIALPSMLSCLLVYPREHYLIIQLPLLIWLMAELLSTVVRKYSSVRMNYAYIGLAAVLLLVYFILPRQAADFNYFDMRKEDGKLNNLTMLNYLNANEDILRDKVLLSHEGDFSRFTEASIDFRNALEKKETPFDEFLQEVDPDLIYCTQTIFNNPDYLSDETWMEFIGDLYEIKDEWRYLGVSGSEEDFMLVRPSLFDQMKFRD